MKSGNTYTVIQLLIICQVIIYVNGWCWPWDYECKEKKAREEREAKIREKERRFHSLQNGLMDLDQAQQRNASVTDRMVTDRIYDSLQPFHRDVSNREALSPKDQIDNFQKNVMTWKRTIEQELEGSVERLQAHFQTKLSRLESHTEGKMKACYDLLKKF